MAVTDYSTTAGNNSTISGVNIAEGCSPAGINNAIRQMMADVRAFYDATPLIAGAPTVSGNWTVSGAWTITGSTAYNDSVKAYFGTGQDAEIYFNATDFVVKASAGKVLLLGDNVWGLSADGLETLFTAAKNGAFTAYYDNTARIATTATGATVSGLLSGTTIGGAMVSTSVATDTGSTTKVPHVAAVEAAISASTPTSLLGTITTNSGATQSLGSLTLTSYKFLRCVIDGVSFSTGAQLTLDSINVSGASAGAATVFHGIVDIDLATGVASGMVGVSGSNSNLYTANTSYGTATTSITFGASTGTFDAGSIRVYGLK